MNVNLDRLVDALAQALEARKSPTRDPRVSQTLESAFMDAVRNALREIFRDDSFVRADPFHSAVLTAMNPTKIRK